VRASLDVANTRPFERKPAWRQGDLIHSGPPLKDVLAGRLRVGGAFHTDQIEAIFTALENNFGIHAEWIGPRHVRFTSSREMPPIRD
jgi:ferric-dicitrate binding protein FerR (iron transport regulator)